MFAHVEAERCRFPISRRVDNPFAALYGRNYKIAIRRYPALGRAREREEESKKTVIRDEVSLPCQKDKDALFIVSESLNTSRINRN